MTQSSSESLKLIKRAYNGKKAKIKSYGRDMSNCSLKRDESVLKENSIAAEINNQDTNRSMISCRCSEESRNHLNRTTHIVKLDDSMVRATRSDHSEGGGG